MKCAVSCHGLCSARPCPFPASVSRGQGNIRVVALGQLCFCSLRRGSGCRRLGHARGSGVRPNQGRASMTADTMTWSRRVSGTRARQCRQYRGWSTHRAACRDDMAGRGLGLIRPQGKGGSGKMGDAQIRTRLSCSYPQWKSIRLCMRRGERRRGARRWYALDWWPDVI